MSIQNLLGGPVPRSELDDWESALYVLCWFGMYGVSEADRAKRREEMKRDKRLLSEPKRWEIGTFREIASAKRDHMGDTEVFKECILDNFILGEDYDMLKLLAEGLHRLLFFNWKLGPHYHGTASMPAPAPVFALAQVDASGSPTPKPKSLEEMVAALSGGDALANVNPFQRRFEKRTKIVAGLLKLIAVAASGARKALGF